MFQVKIGYLYQAGWERSATPITVRNRSCCHCHCSDSEATEFRLSRKVWIPSEVFEGAGFHITKKLTVYHCERCGSDEVEGELDFGNGKQAGQSRARQSQPKRALPQVIVINGRGLTPEQVEKLMQLAKAKGVI